ncbi:hypothetical protein Scep_000781 [Stephania cephalantha]|uniref:BZIP domain-containing protein n=1 Tax=Stephania cephalantha TaxID=152367 RepID=A0AAP0L7S6_9MAGN
MGSDVVDAAAVKSSKQTPSTNKQETPIAPAYPDWQASMQHFIPAYGTPLTYHPIFPHGGLYSHPNIAGPAPVTTETDGKGPNEEERVIMKKSKGDLGDTAGGKSKENVSGFGNDAASQRWLNLVALHHSPSGSEDASNSSEKNMSQQEEAKERRFDQMTGHGANGQNGTLAIESSPNAPRQSATNLNHASLPGKPASNSNIRTNLWNGSSAGAVALKSKPSESDASPQVAPSRIVGHEDERELKKLKRKQSNRESARRSRLRKQEECEQLQTSVERLNNENETLKKNIKELSEKCEALSNENAAIRAELERSFGADISLQNYTLTQLVNGDDDAKNDRPKEIGSASEDIVNSLNSKGNLGTQTY